MAEGGADWVAVGENVMVGDCVVRGREAVGDSVIGDAVELIICNCNRRFLFRREDVDVLDDAMVP